MDKKTYQELEKMLRNHKIREDIDEVFLELAEALADEKTVGETIVKSVKYGKVKVEVCGVCSENEEDAEELDVYMEWIQIGSERIMIEDYVL